MLSKYHVNIYFEGFNMPVSEVYETGRENIVWQVNDLLIGAI